MKSFFHGFPTTKSFGRFIIGSFTIIIAYNNGTILRRITVEGFLAFPQLLSALILSKEEMPCGILLYISISHDFLFFSKNINISLRLGFKE
jgi:hypothetical protein